MFRRLIDVVLFIVLIQVWQFGFLGYLAIREIYDAITRYRSRGEITSRGLILNTSSEEIPFTDIKEISGGYERSLLIPDTVMIEVSLPGKRDAACLKDTVITKLVKTHLNNWTISTTYDIDTPLIVVTPGSAEEATSISYNKVGKYALPPYLVSLIGFPVFGLSILGLYCDLYNAIGFLIIIAIFAGICFIPSFYQEVLVQLDQKGVSLKSDISESFLPYTEVAKVESALFRIKVTHINGEVFYFPKACYLLAELINEFMKEAHDVLKTNDTQYD